MSTFAQTPTGGLVLTASKQFAIVTDPDTQCAQKLQNLFRTFLGEWFLDIRQGVPWFSAVFVKNPSLQVIRQIFAEVILSVPWVVRIASSTISLVGRQLAYTFQATTQSGAVISGGIGKPFIVTVPAGTPGAGPSVGSSGNVVGS